MTWCIFHCYLPYHFILGLKRRDVRIPDDIESRTNDTTGEHIKSTCPESAIMPTTSA